MLAKSDGQRVRPNSHTEGVRDERAADGQARGGGAEIFIREFSAAADGQTRGGGDRIHSIKAGAETGQEPEREDEAESESSQSETEQDETEATAADSSRQAAPQQESEEEDPAFEEWCQVCEDSPLLEEEAPIRKPRNPSDPTPEEKERHWATHLPFRPWCPVCVKAKGKEDPHLSGKKKNEGEDMDMVAIDYASIGEGEDSHARKLLIGRDRRTRYIFCHLVKRKGMEDERIVGKILRSITEIGNTKMILKTDGEPALVQVQEEIINRRPQRTIPENPPAYDPQSNGAAERAVQEI